MFSLIYRRYGEPVDVLEPAEVADPAAPAAGEVLIRVTSRPVHAGDLLGIRGRYRVPGDTSDVAPGGARPGFEGAGIVEAVGAGIDLAPGTRVAFFPGRGAWGEKVLVPGGFVTALPDDIPDAVAGQLHVNPLTAALLLRAAVEAGAGEQNAIVLTAAGSAVAKLVAAMAQRRGIPVIGLVRRKQAVAGLADAFPGLEILSTDRPDWPEQLRALAGDRPIQAVLDAVGGPMASRLVSLLAGGGTLVSYGDLSGEPLSLTALSFSVRNIAIRGVSVGRWAGLPAPVRAGDVAAALDLARHRPDLFAVAAAYDLSQVADAVRHAERTGKDGAVLLTSAVGTD